MRKNTEDQGRHYRPSPALIGMSLRQDNPGGLLSSSARFRFSCQSHSAIQALGCTGIYSQWRPVPFVRVSKLDTVHLAKTGDCPRTQAHAQRGSVPASVPDVAAILDALAEMGKGLSILANRNGLGLSGTETNTHATLTRAALFRVSVACFLFAVSYRAVTGGLS